MNLYNLTTEYQQLIPQLYDHETGEVNMDVDAQLDALAKTTNEKFIAVASWIKNIELEKTQIEAMKADISQREAAYNKTIEKAKTYLFDNMERCNVKELRSQYFTLRIKENPYSTDIYDETLIPEEFMRTREIIKTETKADKVAIKERVIKTGVQIPGAFVQKKTKLEILTDKI